MLYADKIGELVNIEPGVKIDVFVMEKKDVCTDDTYTKDGIHILIGLKMHKAIQVILRKRVIADIAGMWDDIQITNPNSWADVFDEAVTKGQAGWPLYGSSKPGKKVYEVKYHYILSVKSDGNWSPEKKQHSGGFKPENYMEKLSARYTGNPECKMKQTLQQEFDLAKLELGRKTKHQPSINSHSSKGKYTLPISKSIGANFLDYRSITSEDMLDEALDGLFKDIGHSNYKLKETHRYVMSLPISYYGPGSYTKWLRVGWALANTSPKLFLSWLKMSCQENCRETLRNTSTGKFDWACVAALHDEWDNFDKSSPDRLTDRSIMYWTRNDAPEKYREIYKETINFFVEATLKSAMPTEFDLARVLYNMYSGEYVCVDVSSKAWYQYDNKRCIWKKIDCGTTLRNHISIELHQIYSDKLNEQVDVNAKDTTDTRDTRKIALNAAAAAAAAAAATPPETDDTKKLEMIRARNIKLSNICDYVKKTTWKNNIMREAADLFFNGEFIEKLDQNPKLLCFKNYVVDFSTSTHRRGQPDDYLSMCTNIDYIPHNPIKNTILVEEINTFFEQLFPDESLRKYMWEHLSSVLVGDNGNQTLSTYIGKGSNGKSKLVELMGESLGDYKVEISVGLITQKRGAMGSASPEVAKLMGARYVVMNEPSKTEQVNEGVMKEYTGSDKIQCRALYGQIITFIPQFTLVLCTNMLFQNMSNDDGLWRRMRLCDFESKFVEEPFQDIQYPKKEYPFQFKIDKHMDERFKKWAPVFMSMLVDIAYRTKGNVVACKKVLASSSEYRGKQDYFTQFIKDKIQEKPNDCIKKTALIETFKNWYTAVHGRNVPKGQELYDFMDKKYGPYQTDPKSKLKGWPNIAIIYDDDGGGGLLDEM